MSDGDCLGAAAVVGAGLGRNEEADHLLAKEPDRHTAAGGRGDRAEPVGRDRGDLACLSPLLFF